MSYPTIVLLTDFGDGNGSGAMTGVCKRVNANLKVYDLTNDISHFDVRASSLTLSNQLSSWPQGSVFVCAVDPASGTNERVLACLTKDGYLLVGPDNGCLSYSITEHGAKEVRDVSALNTSYLNNEQASVYHGRNLAYCGACIASGKPVFSEAGDLCNLADIKTAY